MTFFLGIDLGASSLKACLINAQGERLALVRAALETHRPATGWSEQNPEAWRAGVSDALQQLHETHAAEMAQLSGISFSGGAHIGVLCDEDARPLRPAIMWDDQRAVQEARALAAQGEVERISGNRPNATWTLPQLMWLAAHEPDIIAQTKQIYFAKDWLRHQLTGDATSDASEAVGAMMAQKNGQWSPALKKLSGLDDARFPELVAPLSEVGTVTKSAAETYRLPEAVSVYQSAIDTSVEWLCASPQTNDIASLKLASAGVLAFTTAAPDSFPPVSFYPHIVPPLHYHAAGMSDCMGAIEWVRQNFTPQLSADAFAAAAQNASIGAEGLMFYPYLSGARAPFWDASLTAEIYGLTRATTADAIARAAYEGVGHVLTAIWHDMTTRLGHTPATLHVLGGGARLGFFCQMLSDMLDVPLRVAAETDCAFATALLAATAHGSFADLPQAAQHGYTQSAEFTPDKTAHTRYSERHSEFMKRHNLEGGSHGNPH